MSQSVFLPNRRGLLIGGGAVLLTGCSDLIGPSATPQQLYVLRPTGGAAAGGPKVSWSLAVSTTTTSEHLASARIALTQPTTRLITTPVRRGPITCRGWCRMLWSKVLKTVGVYRLSLPMATVSMRTIFYSHKFATSKRVTMRPTAFQPSGFGSNRNLHHREDVKLSEA